MKIDLEQSDIQAMAEKVVEITATSRVQRWAQFQAQALYSLARHGCTDASCTYYAMKGTVQAWVE